MKNKKSTYREKIDEDEKNFRNYIIKGMFSGFIGLALIAWGADKISESDSFKKWLNQKRPSYSKQVREAFSGSCDNKLIYLERYSGQYIANPYAVAREEFLDLRNKNPERFKRVTNDEGTEYIMQSYKDGKLKIPRYDCK